MPTKKAATKKPTKKVAKKAAVKKSARKTSSRDEKLLVYANGPTSFWTTDGQILNSLIALRDALDTMEKAVYEHHVTAKKNDFAAWVKDILYDDECAIALKKAKGPKSARTTVVRYLKKYSI